MAESFYNATEGSGKKFRTWNRTIGANSVESESIWLDEYPLASYALSAANISVATTADHIIQVMCGSTLPTRIRRIQVFQRNAVTTAALVELELLRLTTAGTGGTSVTARPKDSADAAAGCTGMTLPTVKGTEGVSFGTKSGWLVQTAPAGGNAALLCEWVQQLGEKPWLIPAGTANGFAVKVGTGRAGASVNVIVDVVETSFV